jgi:hypothetical protein
LRAPATAYQDDPFLAVVDVERRIMIVVGRAAASEAVAAPPAAEGLRDVDCHDPAGQRRHGASPWGCGARDLAPLAIDLLPEREFRVREGAGNTFRNN